MKALFELSIDSEILSAKELQQLTGCSRRNDQVAWLIAAGWQHVRTRAGEPVVGRLYARMKLAGISPTAAMSGGWAPDFTSLR